MPSSLIFAGLVVLWLLILVPAVARHQQEVARPSVAALSGRVLERPQRRYRNEEVDDVYELDQPARRVGATVPADEYPADDYDYDYEDYEEDNEEDYDDRWERPTPRYRPGRGGFDPEAAALAARYRYAFRQRVVLGLLIGAVLTGALAAFAVPALWWLHLLVDVALVGYLVYLRRQVRMEEAIRDRRAARMAGTHRPRSADDPELDEWARRGQEATRRDLVEEPPRRTPEPLPEPVRVTAPHDEEPALPRLAPTPPPPLPPGTRVVDDDLDDPSLHDLGGPVHTEHRRAMGA